MKKSLVQKLVDRFNFNGILPKIITSIRSEDMFTSVMCVGTLSLNRISLFLETCFDVFLRLKMEKTTKIFLRLRQTLVFLREQRKLKCNKRRMYIALLKEKSNR